VIEPALAESTGVFCRHASTLKGSPRVKETDAMSSALAMILAAAMAVPGNGPEAVSGEMEQGLDLRGEWEGEWRIAAGGVRQFELSNGRMSIPDILFQIRCQDGNRLRIQWDEDFYLGIYQRCDDRVLICLRDANYGLPTSFGLDERQIILILRRVKPRE
jgi:hypothetical protein